MLDEVAEKKLDEAAGPAAQDGLRLLYDLHRSDAADVPAGTPSWLDGLDASALAADPLNDAWSTSYRHRVIQLGHAVAAALARLDAAASLRRPLHGEMAFYNIAVLGDDVATGPAAQLLPSPAMRLGDPTLDLAQYAAWGDWPPAALPDLLRAYGGADAQVAGLLPRLQLRLCQALLRRHAVSRTLPSRIEVSPYAGWRLQQALSLAAGSLRALTGPTRP